MAQYDADIQAAREKIAAHEQRIEAIALALLECCGDDWEPGDDEGKVDFRPILKAYARSKKVDPLLLQSEQLYKDMIPAMIHTILVETDGTGSFEATRDLEPEDEEQLETATDKQWVEIVGSSWDFQTYDFQEFVKLAQQKSPVDPSDTD
jgi:hypothetical protein